MSNIRIHPKYGLNPTLVACFLCGEDKNEIALLGAASKRLTGCDEAPRRTVLDQEPCPKCKEWMEKGIIMVGVLGELRPGTCPTSLPRSGHFLVVSDDMIRRFITPNELRDAILRQRMVFAPADLCQTFMDMEAARKAEDDARQGTEGGGPSADRGPTGDGQPGG